jgi:glutamate 5-kinase
MRNELLQNVSRIVVKLGTGVLTDASRHPDETQMSQLVAQLAGQVRAGREVVLVTSGAVGAGMGAMGYSRRPGEVSKQQACAAVGQSRLMTLYQRLFAAHKLVAAQVLLTHADLEHKERHLNARNTLITLLDHGMIPVINENDAVSFTELKFGDNDMLSALVAALLPSDLLVILTTVDGVIENFGKRSARTLTLVNDLTEAQNHARDTDSATAVGGMTSKVAAAKVAVRSGIPMVIASGRKQDALERILAGEDEGTLFVPKPGKMRGRKRWIAFFHHPKGTLYADDGARKAIREQGKSLLPPGVARCEGDFDTGDVLRICDLNGTEFARGIAAFSGDEIRARQLKRVEVVHRDDLVLL